MTEEVEEIIAVVDCDEIAFQISAACEKRTIKVTNSLNDSVAAFKTRTEFKNFTKGLEIPDELFVIEDVQVADDLPNALHSCKVVLDNIKEACKATKMELYLSGKDNFRDSLPLPSKYKDNRKDTIKPLLLQDIRAYLVRKGAKIVNNQEVDDTVCSRMWDGYKAKTKIIGITTDKDACGTVGWLYNRDKMEEPTFIDGKDIGELSIDGKNKVRGFGRKWLYHQIILGDPVDGYNPAEICGARFGEKSSYKILEQLTTDKECWQVIYDLYKGWYPDITKYTDWQGIEREVDVFFILQMYFDAARMRRWPTDTLDVKEILTKMEVKL